MKIIQAILITIFLFFNMCVYADKFENSQYQVCFTPYENCTKSIVDRINEAKKTILVQAYSFTSKPIGKALINAHKRGVDVRMILDKSQYMTHQYSSALFFKHYNIPIWIDDAVTTAHNKVMIIDDKMVITGSFNFTRAAQEKNAENVLMIWDTAISKKYKTNWERRLKVSTVVR